MAVNITPTMTDTTDATHRGDVAPVRLKFSLEFWVCTKSAKHINIEKNSGRDAQVQSSRAPP